MRWVAASGVRRSRPDVLVEAQLCPCSITAVIYLIRLLVLMLMLLLLLPGLEFKAAALIVVVGVERVCVHLLLLLLLLRLVGSWNLSILWKIMINAASSAAGAAKLLQLIPLLMLTQLFDRHFSSDDWLQGGLRGVVIVDVACVVVDE